MEEEVWCDIPGYEGRYQISNYGNVYSFLKDKQLQWIYHSFGYPRVHLRDAQHKKTTCYVHRLVASVFLDPPPQDGQIYEVNHIDEDPRNPYYKNLEWVTHQDNINYSHNRHREEWQKKYREGYRKEEPIIVFDNGKVFHIYKNVKTASQELGLAQSTIRKRLREGKVKTWRLPNLTFKFLYSYLDERRQLTTDKNN